MRNRDWTSDTIWHKDKPSRSQRPMRTVQRDRLRVRQGCRFRCIMLSFVNLQRFDISVATYAYTLWACKVVHAFLDGGERRVFFTIIKLAVEMDKVVVGFACLSGQNGTVPAFRDVENHAVCNTVNHTVVPFEILVHTALPHASWQLILVNYPPPKGGELLVFASTEQLVLTR